MGTSGPIGRRGLFLPIPPRHRRFIGERMSKAAKSEDKTVFDKGAFSDAAAGLNKDGSLHPATPEATSKPIGFGIVPQSRPPSKH